MNIVKKVLKMIKGGFKFVKNYLSRNMIRRTMYAGYYKKLALKENVILYEAFFGRGMLCGPYAIFLEALNDKRMDNFTHVWAIENKDEMKRLKAEYKAYKNVRFIHYGYTDYIKALASAKYLVNNVSFPSFYTKKEGQVYLNTWHGIPLKSLGFDMPNGAIEVSNVLKNFLATDYMISANPFLTEIYKKAYKLEGLYEGSIIEEGYPRLDILFRFSREDIFKKLSAFGVNPDPNKKIILYAPTWKGENYAHADASVDVYFEFKEKLEKLIDTNKYQILIKPHQRVYQLAKEKLDKDFIVPAMMDANEILNVTDVLISDFSSIFYDYLSTGRPVLFFIEDVESYKEQRGMYHGLDHLPGPVAENITDLSKLINNLSEVEKQWKEKYDQVAEYAAAVKEGGVSKKIIDIAFFNETKNYKITKCRHDKKRIFISRGKMLNNGITTAFINLLNAIDYDKYDVTVMIARCPEDSKTKSYQNINPNVRVIYRNSTYNMTIPENINYRLTNRFGMKNIYKPIFKREWDRCYPGCNFDILVDYEGYNYFYQLLLLQNTDKPKYVWLHNDMMEEYSIKYEWLMKIFKIYDLYDGVVACGREIMDVNREKLVPKFIKGEKLTQANNVINFERVLEKSAQDVPVDENGNKRYLVSESYFTEHWENGELVREEFDEEYMPFTPETGKQGRRNIRFVTIGRLSIEKNQEALIRAFARLNKENPDTYLYILGDGPLKEELLDLISKLKMTEHIFMPGFCINPYIVLKNSDCFILPSHHEGQPVVVHEARTLHLPIIVSDFSSVNGVLTENGQLVIGQSEEDIYGGLCAFIKGEVPAGYHFDYKEYNEEAYQQFISAIGA
ncbi:MAG: CDP-glycerol glycerophosphotransferase family protein [Lachnospiraceae bacterium]|nr:CDP-glycerol glycerophosphotransferase family protein [Lachnospiraceae bacterium]